MVLMTPLPGDLLVRRDEAREQFSIVDADTGKRLAGPFGEERNAESVAMAMGRMRTVRVWAPRNGELVRLI
jgi:hypothetical protein